MNEYILCQYCTIQVWSSVRKISLSFSVSVAIQCLSRVVRGCAHHWPWVWRRWCPRRRGPQRARAESLWRWASAPCRAPTARSAGAADLPHCEPRTAPPHYTTNTSHIVTPSREVSHNELRGVLKRFQKLKCRIVEFVNYVKLWNYVCAR